MIRIIALMLMFLAEIDNAYAIECQNSMQRGHSYRAWRLIDGRQCWYEGAPGMNKSLLHWSVKNRADESETVNKPKQSQATPEVQPAPLEVLQMVPIMPPRLTFEERWRLR
jgi:hypothetical protein